MVHQKCPAIVSERFRKVLESGAPAAYPSPWEMSAPPARVLVAETAPRYRDELLEALRSDPAFEIVPVPPEEVAGAVEREPFALAVIGLRQTHTDPLVLVRRTVELGIPCLVTAAGFYDREAREVCQFGADSVWMYPLDVDRFLARARALLEPATVHPRILLVEDNEDTRRAFRRTLEAAGYSVVEADRGVEGVRLALSRRIDAAVVDVQMKGMDGLAVCQILKGEPATARLPVLVCTVRAGAEDELKATAAGADAFLAKPFRPDMLVEAVRKLIERVKAAKTV